MNNTVIMNNIVSFKEADLQKAMSKNPGKFKDWVKAQIDNAVTMTREDMYKELVHYAAGVVLDKMSDAEMVETYNKLFN